jgi:hypothetical protein
MSWKKGFMDGSALPDQPIAISNHELLPNPPALATSFSNPHDQTLRQFFKSQYQQIELIFFSLPIVT